MTLWSLPAFPQLSAENLLGLAYMSLIGGAATYVLWFRGIARLEPSVVSLLGVLSPLSAVVLGWVFLGEVLTAKQATGAGLALFSLWLGQSGLRWRRRRVTQA